MSKEEIISGNKLIAEFMGYVYYPDNIINNEEGTLEKDGKMSLHANFIGKPFCPKYHSSWDWLMTVVEKIESLGYDTQVNRFVLDVEVGNECLINPEGTNSYDDGYQFIGHGNCKIDATWLAVIGFIKFYNQQSK